MDTLDIKKEIEDNNIKTHKELQKHLCELSGCAYYWDYPYSRKDSLTRFGLIKYCIEIELEGMKMFYEKEKF